MIWQLAKQLVTTGLLALLPTLALAEPKAESRPAAAESKPKEHDKDADREKSTKEEPPVTSSGHVTVNGQTIDYTATAGTIALNDAEGKPTGKIFYTAYTRDGVESLGSRSITFSFNGGPGSSSVWLHLGLLGPKRVKLDAEGGALPPPYQLIANEFSLLDETDLVFIDPIGTGFSRAQKPDEARKFWGVQEDASSVSEFIRLYLTQQRRWSSPKFLIGESYGTTRAAALASELSDRQGINVNGIMLVSLVLNFQTLGFQEGNDLPYVLFLPSYTAVAWYHHRLPADLQQRPLAEVLHDAEAFAASEYQQALFSGSDLNDTQRQALADELARFTGLKTDLILKSNLRVPQWLFSAQLLNDEGKVVGRYDGRYMGLVRKQVNLTPDHDPSYQAVSGAFAATINEYLRTELGYKNDQRYEVLTDVGPWNWGENAAYVNVSAQLAKAMTRNPFLRVHVSLGYFDLATPYWGAKYTMTHLGIPPALEKNIVYDDFQAGHMMYLNSADLKKQKEGLARFIQSTLHAEE